MKITNTFTAYRNPDDRYHADFADIAVTPDGSIVMIARTCGQWAHDATYKHGRPLTFFEADARITILRMPAGGDAFTPVCEMFRGLAFDPIICRLADGRLLAAMVVGEARPSSERGQLKGVLHRHIPQLGTAISVRGIGVWFSDDGGLTWTGGPQMISLPGWENIYNLRKPTQLADGTILMPITTGYPYRTRFVALFRSWDGGRTWCDPSVVAEDPAGRAFYSAGNGFWEPAMAVCPLGDTVCICVPDAPEGIPHSSAVSAGMMVSGERPPKLQRVVSRDSGFTWSIPHETSLSGDFPSMVVLPRGRLLLTYTQRAVGMSRALATVSDDLGISWGERSILLESAEELHYYPNTTLLPDGGLLTVVMVADSSNLRRVDAVRWRLG